MSAQNPSSSCRGISVWNKLKDQLLKQLIAIVSCPLPLTTTVLLLLIGMMAQAMKTRSKLYKTGIIL